jgi:thiopeptide-type bacteriocin biosynthesis protein
LIEYNRIWNSNKKKLITYFENSVFEGVQDPIENILNSYRATIQQKATELSEKLEISYKNKYLQIITSLLHMHVNRMLISNHRKQETIIMHIVYKYTKQKLDRLKNV